MAAIGHDFTARLLANAGIAEGQRVLDIGCGTGEVSLLARELVGATGAVVGLDNAAGPLDVARGQARASGLSNVTFVQGDLGKLPPDIGLFDAVVGRRVLMYQRDAVAALREVGTCLRPGGLVVLHEHDGTMTPASLVGLPLHHRAQGWLRQMLEREGADIHMGFNLHGVLDRAGLRVEHVRAEAIVQTPDAPYALAPIIRAVLPRLVAHGIAAEDEIDIDTLDRRLSEEREASGATYIGDMMFGVWARKS